jgi:hypothetical protein
MFMPADYLWFEPVLIAAIVVFVVSWIGNSILFNNRFLNAFVTAVVFAIIFGALAYSGYGLTMKSDMHVTTSAPTR